VADKLRWAREIIRRYEHLEHDSVSGPTHTGS
jgi:hypothetical protein